MATAAAHSRPITGEHRFFLSATWLLALMTVSGFAFNLAAGRSSFSAPLIYHVHASIFLTFIGIYTWQVTLAARGKLSDHYNLGRIGAGWIPLMLVLGAALTFRTLQITGGPFFFGQAEFLFVNLFHLAGFAGLAFAGLACAALGRTRRTDWHKRLMFGALVTVSVPGIARLLPLPLMIPYAFPVAFMASSLFIVAGMVMDQRLHGGIHKAWWWALLVPLAMLTLGEAVASTDTAKAWVAGHVAGTPGGERPPGPFLPPGF